MLTPDDVHAAEVGDGQHFAVVEVADGALIPEPTYLQVQGMSTADIPLAVAGSPLSQVAGPMGARKQWN